MSNISVIKKGEYADRLAPFDKEEDFSTASRLRDKGFALTGEKLAKLSKSQMIS